MGLILRSMGFFLIFFSKFIEHPMGDKESSNKVNGSKDNGKETEDMGEGIILDNKDLGGLRVSAESGG